MLNKYFYIDNKRSVIISYSKLISDLSDIDFIPKYLYVDDAYVIFTNLIISLIYDKPITLLDSDLTLNEVVELGIPKTSLTTGFNIIQKKEITEKSFINILQKSKKWYLTLLTSGTTGPPKMISHKLNELTRMVKIATSKKDDIWGFAYNPTHIAGVQVFFQAFFNLNTIVNLFKKSKSEIKKNIETYNITNISATPTFYRLLLPFNKVYYSVKRITSGGEKFDNKISVELKKMFPNAKLLNIYASTEAGSLFVSNGDIFEITSDLTNMIKIKNNELLINRKLLGFSNDIKLENEWYYTGDIVKIVNKIPLRFRFITRKNEIINVGGYNVNPLEVEEIINNHSAVLNSRVVGRKNSVVGNILIADVKLIYSLSEKDLIDYLKTKLQYYKIPRIINFKNKLEITRTGKIKRK